MPQEQISLAEFLKKRKKAIKKEKPFKSKLEKALKVGIPYKTQKPPGNA